MKMSSRSLVAILIFAGFAATGCSQQQTAPIDTGTAEIPVAPPYVEEKQQPVVRPIPMPAPAPVVRPHPPMHRPAAPVIRPLPPKPVVPPVKAKGNYRGRVQIDPNLSNHYQY